MQVLKCVYSSGLMVVVYLPENEDNCCGEYASECSKVG
ncbi:hypothetical protein SALWKB29_0087 [Snodgrassella communis]|uniref:Uncharacterized protein n=1 Tax=Snodgrassella communis TaxID=2946699 RepID=A0A837AH87_9NEIS|nr:hypothetical protein SALWKB29_0087 [Snodgrassella communis]